MANAVLILFVIAYIIVSGLILWNIAGYCKYFHRETQLFVSEMNRAEQPDVYRYWHKKLRCHYLCLIPFVNRRNVERVYTFFYHRQKPVKKEKHSDGIFHILAPSAAAACLCVVCLCGMSWAWFTASATSGAHAIKTPRYTIASAVMQNEAAQSGTLRADGSMEYALASGTYTVTLTSSGTENATGYSIVKIGDATYYTTQISANRTFSFTITANGTVSVIITPSWGSSAARTEANKISAGAVLQADGAVEAPSASAEEDTTAADPIDAKGPAVTPSGAHGTVPSKPAAEAVTTEPVTEASEQTPTQEAAEDTTAVSEEETTAVEPVESDTENGQTAETPAETEAPEAADTGADA